MRIGDRVRGTNYKYYFDCFQEGVIVDTINGDYLVKIVADNGGNNYGEWTKTLWLYNEYDLQVIEPIEREIYVHASYAEDTALSYLETIGWVKKEYDGVAVLTKDLSTVKEDDDLLPF